MIAFSLSKEAQTNSDFMIGLLLDNKTATEAASKLSELKSRLKASEFSFGEIAPIILTDNGGEFSNISAFENDESGKLESHMFFCEPNASYEKPHIEKNHTLFRDIVPSGSSFDRFTQESEATKNLATAWLQGFLWYAIRGSNPGHPD